MILYNQSASLQHMLMGQIQLFWCTAEPENFPYFLNSDIATPLNQFP